jgi:hypothetical protein
MLYTIFIDTLCGGIVPAIHDGDGRVVAFASREEAGMELADHMITQYQQVVDGERDIDDVSHEEWVDVIQVDCYGKVVGLNKEYVIDSVPAGGSDHNTLMAIRDRLSAHDVDARAARDVINILLRAGFNLMDPTTGDLYPAA